MIGADGYPLLISVSSLQAPKVTTYGLGFDDCSLQPSYFHQLEQSCSTSEARGVHEETQVTESWHSLLTIKETYIKILHRI